MTFRKVYGRDDNPDTFYVDDYPVPEWVYEGLYPRPDTPPQRRQLAFEAFLRLKVGVELPPRRPAPTVAAVSGAKPLKSDALAVHTSQIPAAVARNKRHGLNVRYDRAGRPVFTDNGQRKALMRIESEVMGKRIIDRSSFYG